MVQQNPTDLTRCFPKDLGHLVGCNSLETGRGLFGLKLMSKKPNLSPKSSKVLRNIQRP